MAILYTNEIPSINISTQAKVIDFVLSSEFPMEVYASVALGDDTRPISGNGVYKLLAYVNDRLVVPISQVFVPNAQKIVCFSKPIMLVELDNLEVFVEGMPTDTNVYVYSSVRDATPARAEEIYGIGPTVVDHNYGGIDNLRYIKNGVGVDNACIYCYLKSDFDAGRLDNQYIVARTTTRVDGRWERPMMLDPGEYTLMFFKQGITGPDTVSINVT